MIRFRQDCRPPDRWSFGTRDVEAEEIRYGWSLGPATSQLAGYACVMQPLLMHVSTGALARRCSRQCRRSGNRHRRSKLRNAAAPRLTAQRLGLAVAWLAPRVEPQIRQLPAPTCPDRQRCLFSMSPTRPRYSSRPCRVTLLNESFEEGPVGERGQRSILNQRNLSRSSLSWGQGKATRCRCATITLLVEAPSLRRERRRSPGRPPPPNLVSRLHV
jgi:hypothetical protein